MTDITGRTDFVETWLTEMPEGKGSFATFDDIAFNINDMKNSSGVTIISLPNNLKKIDMNQTAYYWYEKNGELIMGVELEKKPQGLVVILTGKNPKFKGQPPYASDLYSEVLKDSKTHSIRLLSDVTLSDEGYNIWKNLFKNGNKITIYDAENPGRTYKTFDSIDDFDKFFKIGDTAYRRYQYVLSESNMMLAETRGSFHTRRYREMAGIL